MFVIAGQLHRRNISYVRSIKFCDGSVRVYFELFRIDQHEGFGPFAREEDFHAVKMRATLSEVNVHVGCLLYFFKNYESLLDQN